MGPDPAVNAHGRGDGRPSPRLAAESGDNDGKSGRAERDGRSSKSAVGHGELPSGWAARRAARTAPVASDDRSAPPTRKLRPRHEYVRLRIAVIRRAQEGHNQVLKHKFNTALRQGNTVRRSRRYAIKLRRANAREHDSRRHNNALGDGLFQGCGSERGGRFRAQPPMVRISPSLLASAGLLTMAATSLFHRR